MYFYLGSLNFYWKNLEGNIWTQYSLQNGGNKIWTPISFSRICNEKSILGERKWNLFGTV